MLLERNITDWKLGLCSLRTIKWKEITRKKSLTIPTVLLHTVYAANVMPDTSQF